jgi:Flp pilus assembly protein TadG
MMRLLNRLLRRTDGAVALEMGLVMPMLALMLYGIHDFGTVYVEALQVEHATQTAATYAYKQFVASGSVTQSAIQTAVTASEPIPVTVAATQFCGAVNAGATSVTSAACPGGGTYITLSGSMSALSTHHPWSVFPTTLTASVTVRVK